VAPTAGCNLAAVSQKNCLATAYASLQLSSPSRTVEESTSESASLAFRTPNNNSSGMVCASEEYIILLHRRRGWPVDRCVRRTYTHHIAHTPTHTHSTQWCTQNAHFLSRTEHTSHTVERRLQGSERVDRSSSARGLSTNTRLLFPPHACSHKRTIPERCEFEQGREHTAHASPRQVRNSEANVDVHVAIHRRQIAELAAERVAGMQEHDRHRVGLPEISTTHKGAAM
jgi:hypothetical protein